jgi:hypothetical protein
MNLIILGFVLFLNEPDLFGVSMQLNSHYIEPVTPSESRGNIVIAERVYFLSSVQNIHVVRVPREFTITTSPWGLKGPAIGDRYCKRLPQRPLAIKQFLEQ